MNIPVPPRMAMIVHIDTKAFSSVRSVRCKLHLQSYSKKKKFYVIYTHLYPMNVPPFATSVDTKLTHL